MPPRPPSVPPRGGEPPAGRPPRRHPRRLDRVAALLAVGAGGAAAAAVGAGIALLEAERPLQEGAAAAEAGLSAARSGDGAGAEERLAAAEAAFLSAAEDLGAWYARPALAVPFVAPQIRAARTLAAAGATTAARARGVARADVAGIRVQGAGIDLGLVAALQRPLDTLAASLEREHARVAAARSRWLVEPIAGAVEQAEARLATARDDAATAAGAVRLATAMLGAGGDRRYFLAVQNPAEARASGGIIGNFGVLVAEKGRLRLERFGRDGDLNAAAAATGAALEGPVEYGRRYARFGPERVWQNVTMSPHFPSVAEVIEDLYRRQGGGEVDGVVSVDPAGLAALLELTGPVDVPGWPEPLTAANAAPVLLHEQYLRFGNQERVQFLGDATEAVWGRLAGGDLPPLAAVARALSPAVAARHIVLHSVDRGEQRLLERLGAAGALPTGPGDSFGLVTQNAAANKVDWFLRRSLSYDARFDPGTGEVAAVATVELENGAPSSGLPAYVLGGPGGGPFPPGTNRAYLSVYTPLRARAATAGGRPLALEVDREQGRNVYSAYVTVPPGDSLTLRFVLAGRVERGPYRLHLARQPTVHPDTTSVEVRRATDGGASRQGGPMLVSARLELDADITLGWGPRR